MKRSQLVLFWKCRLPISCMTTERWNRNNSGARVTLVDMRSNNRSVEKKRFIREWDIDNDRRRLTLFMVFLAGGRLPFWTYRLHLLDSTIMSTRIIHEVKEFQVMPNEHSWQSCLFYLPLDGFLTLVWMHEYCAATCDTVLTWDNKTKYCWRQHFIISYQTLEW